MEDIYFKYGLFLVGVVVVFLLVSFAFTQLNGPDISSETSFKIAGIENAKLKIKELCQACLQDGINKDCYMLEILIDAPLEENFEANINNPLFEQGTHIIKIINSNNLCILKKMG